MNPFTGGAMKLKPLASLTRNEGRDLIRIHAKLFAFLSYSKLHPDQLEEHAHAYAERHWQQFRGVALDYLAVSLAIAEQEAAASN